MKATEGTCELGAWRGERPGVELRRHLEQIPGLRLGSSYRGILKSGKQRASVCVESLESIRIGLPVTAPAPSALQRELPGNLRFARSTRGLQLIADIDTEPVTLAQSFEEIDWGLRQATQRQATQRVRRRTRAGAAPETSAVQAALEAMGWGEGAVLPHENGWEARPRIGDSPVPVKVDPTSSGLHVHRTVLGSIPGTDSDDRSDQAPVDQAMVHQAVADQALRLNARLRWAKLTCSEGGIVAETHLHSGLVTARALATACRAVAAAAHHSGPLLAVLAQQREVTRQYIDMFSTSISPRR